MPGINRIRQGAASDPIILYDTDDGHDAAVSGLSMNSVDSKTRDVIQREDAVRVVPLLLNSY